MSGKFLDVSRKLNNKVTIPPIVLGSFQINNYQTMLDIIETAVSVGCCGFDTSPSYGSEEILGRAIREVCHKTGITRKNLFISDKIDGWQMFKGNGEVEKYVDQSLKIMKLEYLDLLLVHWPFAKYLLNTWRCFERMYKKGKVKAIGLCNVNSRVLDNFLVSCIEIKPHVIQNEISPLRVCEEEVIYFQNMGIMIEAYSPLCRMVTPIKESDTLKNIAAKYNKTIAQVILRWHIERRIIPIFASTKAERVRSNLSVFDFELTGEDVKAINTLNQDYKIFPESYGCPGY